ncbi:sodium:solute symporter family protein [Alkalibacillus haloalkaliphilus]|uniref:Sodium:solute symport protein n=1 Tax=Alkalibacillus haloalkaliphilus TaxID=94136 RepID=A0A511W934_9BACI|nr:sodium:solute symporter family protein [Alkalibacillus haloalkaliphilus]GEN46573.1 sodium:solute symport protein [Alkalibacillus haloalkaliphilus]
MAWYIGYFFVYFGIVFGFGIYYYFKVKDSDDYLIAGWNMGFWPIVGTIISTFCGAAVFIGWVGMGFSVGMSGFFEFALPAYFFTLILVVFFAKQLRRQKLYTLADLFSERFGGRLGIFPSILSAFIYAVPTLALQIVGMSTVFNIAFNMEPQTGILVAFALILGFTILGGLPATIITDALQSIVLTIGIVVLFVASLNYSGGIGEVLENTPAHYLTPFGEQGGLAVLIFALSVGPFYLIWQSTWQRIFAARTEEVAKKAGLTAIAIGTAISILPYAIGVMARQYVPSDIDPDLIFSYVTVELLPPFIGGLVLVGLLSALMTGANSFILQGSSNLTQDLYARMINPHADNRKMMFVSRLTVIIISVLGLIIAFQVQDIVTLYQWALRLSAVTLVLPFLAIMFWRGVTTAGALSSMMIAGAVTIIWPYFKEEIIAWFSNMTADMLAADTIEVITAFFDETIVGFLTSFIVLIVVSLLTKHSKAENVKAVYKEDFNTRT